ncbi:hypothetical protein [Nostoc sp.]
MSKKLTNIYKFDFMVNAGKNDRIHKPNAIAPFFACIVLALR